MLILFDTDGTPLTLASAWRDEWRRHEDLVDGAALNKRHRYFVHHRPFALGWSISLLPLGLFGVLPWASLVPMALFGYACQWSWGRTNWEIHRRALPLVRGPVVDGERRVAREIRRRLAWSLGLLASGLALARLWPLEVESTVLRAWLLACGLVPALRHGWQLGRLLRVRHRLRTIENRTNGEGTQPC